MKVCSERVKEALYIKDVCICLLTVQEFLLWIVDMRGLKMMYLVLGRRKSLFCWMISMLR